MAERTIRARTGLTTDPIPEGKHLDAEPKKHFDITEAVHNKAAALTEIEERTSAQAKEDRKDHVKEMEHARNEPGFKTTDKNPIGKDSGKQSSVANKLMDSRKAHYGQMQSSR